MINIFLSKTLDRIFGLQRFAEAKNGAMVTFGLAAAFGSLNLTIFSQEKITPYESAYVFAAIPFFLSAIISMISFYPIRSNKKNKKIFLKRNSNILFFQDLAQMDEKQYASILIEKGLVSELEKNLVTEYANQIITMSKITKKKLKYFGRAWWVFIVGTLCVAIPSIVHLWNWLLALV